MNYKDAVARARQDSMDFRTERSVVASVRFGTSTREPEINSEGYWTSNKPSASDLVVATACNGQVTFP